MKFILIAYCTLLLCTACKKTETKKTEFIYPPTSHVEKILSKGFLDISTFYSTTDYYVYKGITRGFHYELARDFADYLGVRLRVIDVNNNLDSAIHRLQKEQYDLIAVSMTVTPEREEKIQFSHPFFKTGEVLVQNNRKNLIHHIEELNGKTIFIKKGSPYKKLLHHIQDSLKIQFNISEISRYSSDELLNLVETGEIDYTITDQNIAQAHSPSMPHLDYSLNLQEGIAISWAIPTHSTDLAKEINTWLDLYKKNGRLNMLYNRYFNYHNQHPSHKSKYTLVKKGDLSPFDKQLKEAAKLLNWDWRLLAALVYNESKFDPEAESHVGAYGLMQIIPETASMFKVFDYFSPDSNIYTGIQYLKYLDNIFSEYPIEPEEKLKFTLASYNAGAGHIIDAMRLAEKYGKNPYIWDNNVDFYIRYKSDPEFYKDSLSRNGYCNGQQTYDYVHRILNSYNNYKHIRN
ncbi:transporter substrate-binding domain-containing protein [Odoribacter lunatus]|uniref:transporter substrate-binding domain-containing protein n=1 Tax=Odoribacter lunatus TaxID=2941335 RepID=UPI00203CA59C|nr:transporter substrate-binding domain-containing protein [Odoribacter lunatus]